MSHSWRPHGLQPTRVLHPWDFPGKSTGVGCHCLLQMCSTYKLNKQGDSIQSWCTPFPIRNQSVVPCPVNCFLICIQISQEAGSHLLKNFSQCVVIHTVKGFGIVNKAKIDGFLEFSCFFDDPTNVGNLISGSSFFLNPP